MINQSTGYALSAQQEQLWAAMGGGNPGRISLLAYVESACEKDIVSSVARAVAKHGIFRTGFVKPQGARQPLQVLGQAATSVDVATIPGNEERALYLRLTTDSLTADMETLRLLLREVLGNLYEKRATAAPPFEYLNVSEWQHDLLGKPEAEGILAWWRSRIDITKKDVQGVFRSQKPGCPKTISFICPAALTHAVCADRREARVIDILLAAWILTQSFFTGVTHQSIACRFDGRFTPELQEVMGPLSRFLPAHFQWSKDHTLQDFVAAVRFEIEEAADRQEYFYPGAIGRDDPLVEGSLAGFALTERQTRFTIGQSRVAILEEQEALLFRSPCTLHCVRDEQELVGWLHYDENIFSHVASSALLDTFLTCLSSYAADPQQRIGRLRPLSDAAQRKLLGDGTLEDGHSMFEAEAALVPELIAGNVHKAAGQLAVICGRRRLSYAELGARASELAQQLRSAGVGPEIPVGIAMHAGAEAIVAMLAVFQAGGIYVPLSPDDPLARFLALLQGLNITVVLSVHELTVDKAANICVVRVNLDTPVASNLKSIFTPVMPAHGAYVIHTSGSTGESRAVLVPHSTLVTSTRARQHFYLAPVQRFLLVSPLTFDSSIAGLFWTLVDGGTLILPQEIPSNAEELRQLIVEHAATHVLCIPRLLQAITEGSIAGELNSLQTAIVAGEACSRNTVLKFLAAAPGCALYNEYGVSEAGVWSTVHRLNADDDEDNVPIGPAISGTRLYVCREDLELLPAGAVGELCIGGISLARGYAGQPSVTAERFLPDPFAAKPGARLYRTGDRVRSIDGHTLLFLGRTDNCVKIRGQRIELEQLEAIIRQSLPVADVAVVVDRRSTSPGLAVCYTNRTDTAVTPEQIRTTLAARLSKGLTPEWVSHVASLPRTATGKLDRRRLEEMLQKTLARAAFSPPQTPIECKLAEIWAPLFGATEISRDDDFFALGGDSIISLQITARARSAGLRMTPRQVMSCRTIAALAAELENNLSAETTIAAASNSLTPVQRWFFAQQFEDIRHYDQALIMQASPDLNMEILRQALKAAFTAHPALQMGFVREQQEWRAYYDPDAQDVSIRILNGSGNGLCDPAELVREAFLNGHGAFELAEPPLMRVLVVNGIADRPSRVLFVAHHLIVDGVSWRIFLEDVALAYEAISRSESPVLVPESISPGQWADCLASRAQQPEIRALAAYWRDESDSAWSLPIDFPGGRNTEADAATVIFTLKPECVRLLVRTDEESFLDASLLSALVRSLAEWSGHQSLWIALEHHGRDIAGEDVDPSRTIGWLTAVTPVRLTCQSSAVAEMVIDVREQLRQAPLEHWFFDYLRYCETGKESVRLRTLPEAPVSFNNLGAVHTTALPHLPLSVVSEDCGPLRSPTAHRTYLLNITISNIDDSLNVQITYSSALHRRQTIERIGERMLVVLEEMCTVSGATVS